ncbi:FecR domain-containing protein [Niabella sp.]|uniref:FecR family protein n=1 Tax=Niabella sp. TaxID=1962976 RepID=UPI002620C35B|nr:FecR domain-containing protein [Niabella sp.]
MDKKLEHKFYRLFALKLSGEATAQELEQLETLLTANPELRFFCDELIKPVIADEAYGDRAEQSFAAHAVDMHLKGLWQEKEQTQAVPGKRGYWRRAAVYIAAACVVLLIVSLTMLFNRKPPAHMAGNETATTKGSKSKVKLPDGTVVMLNANSRLSYDEMFKGSTREVTLTGEAFFDVTHDAAHPFIIHTHAGDIKVLGTAFNVKALDNGFFETTLIRGKVAIRLKEHEDEEILLRPGQKLVTRAKEKKTELLKIVPLTIKDSVVAETSWMKNQLFFDDRPLAEIAEELEQHFGVKIIFQSDKARQFRYTGSYNDTDLDQILELLKLSRPFRFHRDKDVIIIE